MNPQETGVAVAEETKCGCGRPAHHRGRCSARRESSEAAVQKRSDGNVDVTATHAEQIPHLQAELLAWARGKVELVRQERDEAEETLESARAANFRVAQLEHAARREQKRFEFYSKLLAALEAGYVLMPTLDATLFAVRTNRKRPYYHWTRFNREIPEVQAKALPLGEGQYVSAEPITRPETREFENLQGKTEIVWGERSIRLDPEIDFPLEVAKAETIHVTSQALEKKIFDEIGISPGRFRSRTADPILTGRIIAPNGRRISFLLAWHVPTIDI